MAMAIIPFVEKMRRQNPNLLVNTKTITTTSMGSSTLTSTITSTATLSFTRTVAAPNPNLTPNPNPGPISNVEGGTDAEAGAGVEPPGARPNPFVPIGIQAVSIVKSSISAPTAASSLPLFSTPMSSSEDNTTTIRTSAIQPTSVSIRSSVRPPTQKPTTGITLTLGSPPKLTSISPSIPTSVQQQLKPAQPPRPAQPARLGTQDTPNPDQIQVQEVKQSSAPKAPTLEQPQATPQAASQGSGGTTADPLLRPQAPANDRSGSSRPSAASQLVQESQTSNIGNIEATQALPTEILPSDTLPTQISPLDLTSSTNPPSLPTSILSITTSNIDSTVPAATATLTTATGGSAVTSGTAATATGDRDSSSGLPEGSDVTGSGSSGANVNSVNNEAGDSSKSMKGAIAGGTIGAVAAVFFIFLLIWLWRRRARRERQGALPSPMSRSQDMAGGEKSPGPKGTLFSLKESPVFLAGAELFKSKRSKKDLKSSIQIHRPSGSMTREGLLGTRDASQRPDGMRSNNDKVSALGNQSSLGSDPLRLSLRLDRLGFNPFADSNALPSGSGNPSILQQTKSKNPFTDASAVYAPAMTSVADIRKSRAQSQSLSGLQAPRAQNNMSQSDSRQRESQMSDDSFIVARTKFRSDPFDLELVNKLTPNAGEVAQMPRRVVTSSMYSDIRPGSFIPQTADIVPSRGTPHDSLTSRYMSGVSAGDWSEPGPDIGRWDSPTLAEGFQQHSVRSAKRQSEASQGSVIVGQAL